MNRKKLARADTTYEELKAKMLADPECRKAYDDLEEEFALLRKKLEARKQAKLARAKAARQVRKKPIAVTSAR
ncbi:hypothetical protein [Candidatus Spongiihabitans sp.]|uniref:hypothetical protein n=1 Tax=Candidatus Spongiihabitans sp. TaxID=3101308 RepID=UPI003C7D6413